MTRSEKNTAIAGLKEKFSNSSFFYLTDASTMTVEETTQLRRLLFEKGIEMKVVKNTLAKKALTAIEGDNNYDGLFDSLKGPTAILFTEVANSPAKVIEEFRGPKGERPILKAAYIDSSIYLGDDQLKALASLKSKEELIGEIITLLQSPAKNVISGLKSGGSKLAGIIKTLQERAE